MALVSNDDITLLLILEGYFLYSVAIDSRSRKSDLFLDWRNISKHILE